MYNKEYYWNNREKCIGYTKRYQDKHPEKGLARAKTYSANNREKINEQEKDRKANSENYKAARNHSRDLAAALRKNIKSSETIKKLGCSIKQFKRHLERQFTEGMCWENRKEWTLDHIVSIYKIDWSDKKQVEQVTHYTNIRPLWRSDNCSKRMNKSYEEVFGLN